MARTAKAVAAMSRAGEPTIAYMGGTGAVINEAALARSTNALLKPLLGPGVIYIPASVPPMSGSEDWSEVVNAGVPSLYLGIGGYDPKVIAGLKAAGKPVPVNHSPLFAPDAEGAIRTATQAIVLSIVGGVRPSAKP
jgi:hippurate hydrolase